MREREKALLLEWLVLYGKDWVTLNDITEDPMFMEIGRLDRMGYLDDNIANKLNRPNEVYNMAFRLNEKAMKILESDRE
jgi:hypothetical protein